MPFNSLEFVFFFPVAVIFYFLIPHRCRWVWLLACSYFFYMCWNVGYVLLLIAATLISYITGLVVGQENKGRFRKFYFSLGIAGNLSLLFIFKYFNFFNTSLNATFGYLHLEHSLPLLDVLLPVGISFYTFQALSYSIDVYTGRQAPEKHLGIFALYVSFFPQLVAGPIERSTRLLPQFYQKHDFDYQRACFGLQLMLWGLFQKVAIADRLAIVVNQVYSHPTNYPGVTLIIATYFFAFQIYCDFSGYSDIAIGAAQVMGYDIMDNFKRPYFASSIADFWRRWHISLSTWFRDYLYFPMGGNRVPSGRWRFNIMFVFIVSGLWHGANWTFAIWGALHGFYYLCARQLKGLRQSISNALGLSAVPGLVKFINVMITFHLVVFAWIFFRANSLSGAVYISSHLFYNTGYFFKHILDIGRGMGLLGGDLGLGKIEFLATVFLIFFLMCVHLVQTRISIRQFIAKRALWIRWSVYFLSVFILLLLGIFHAENEFIYFQF